MRDRTVFYVMCRIGGVCGPERLGGIAWNEDAAKALSAGLHWEDGIYSYVTTIPPHRETPSLR